MVIICDVWWVGGEESGVEEWDHFNFLFCDDCHFNHVECRGDSYIIYVIIYQYIVLFGVGCSCCKYSNAGYFRKREREI